MKITVIYNQGSSFDVPEGIETADEDTIDSARVVYNTLKKKKFSVELLELTPDKIGTIKKVDSDVIFNLCEWSGRDSHFGVKLLQKISKSGIPYTGADYTSYDWGCNKVKMKNMFNRFKIPTPKWVVTGSKVSKRNRRKLAAIPFPVIIKPVYEHCGIGVHQDSIIDSLPNLERALFKFYEKYRQPILIEEFIDGREFQVTVIKNGALKVLPPAEIIFARKPGMKNAFTYESKWRESTDNDSVFSKFVVPDQNSKAILRLITIAKKVFNKMACRGYVRLDVRLRGNDVFVLEVNVNPGIDPDPQYGMTASSMAAGIDFEKLVVEIMHTALYDQSYKTTPDLLQ